MSNKKAIHLGLDYTEFTGGITEVNRKMKLLDAEFKLAQEQVKNYGNQTEALGIQHDVLSQKILLQKQKVEQASKAYDAAVSSNKATQKELDNLDKKLLEERISLEKLNNQLNKVSESYQSLENNTLSITDKMELLESSFENINSSIQLNASKNEKLKVTQEYLTQKIVLQKQRLDEARTAFEKATSSGEQNEKIINKLTIAYNEEQTKLNQLNNELTETSKKLNENSKKIDTFGDSIRGLANDLGIEINPAIEKFASGFDNISKEVGTAIIGIGAIASSFIGASLNAANFADDLLTLSTVTGITTDELQKMQYASDFLDVDLEVMTGSITKLTRNMYDARGGSSELEKAFKALHIRVTDGRGNLRDANTVFYETIDALGKIKNETERDALAMKVMGKSAKELNPLIEAGSKRLKELGIEAENMGVIMGGDSLEKLGTLKDAMDKFENTSEALKNSLGLSLLPMVTALFTAISSVPVPVLKTLVVLASVITTIVLLVKAIKSVTDTGKTIKTFFDATSASTLKTTAIILGVVAALIALATVIAVISGKSGELQKSMASVGNSVGSITDTVSNTQSSYRTVRNNYRGTNSFSGGATLVGEEGRPELVVPPRGSRIYSADETDSILNGGGDTFIIEQIVIDPKNIQEFEDIIKIVQGQQVALRRGVRAIV